MVQAGNRLKTLEPRYTRPIDALQCWLLALAGLSLLLLPSLGNAQAPEGPVFTNDRQVTIPIRCTQPELVNRFEIYVSPDQGKQWHLYANVPASQQEVTFLADEDGVYWFDLVTHYRDGRAEPNAPGTRPPLLVLYVDTKPPRISLRPGSSPPGEALVQWEIQDEHLDLRTLRLEYRELQSGNWTPLPVIPPTARGEKRWPVPGGGKVLVRLSATDLAENVAQAQVELFTQPVQHTVSNSANVPSAAVAARADPDMSTGSPLAAGSPATPPPPPPAPGVPPNPSPLIAAEVVSKPVVPTSASPATGFAPSNTTGPMSPSAMVGSNPGIWPSKPPTNHQPSPAAPGSASVGNPVPPAPLPAETVSPRVIARSESSGLPTALASWNPNAPSAGQGQPVPTRGTLPRLRYLNTTKASLHYEVSRVGPSGVGAVELWMTRDDGRTWFKAGDDPDLQPPMLVEFPGEGVYGLTLVVRSRVGLGRPAPQPGEPPQLRIEVDSTPPYAELYAVEADPQHRDILILQWSASDKNLAANPITLKWAERESGPWHVIAADLPNTGRYVWKMPENLPYMVYLRLEVRDLAGNLAVAQTPKPVLVDLQEPEVKLLDIMPPSNNH